MRRLHQLPIMPKAAMFSQLEVSFVWTLGVPSSVPPGVSPDVPTGVTLNVPSGVPPGVLPKVPSGVPSGVPNRLGFLGKMKSALQ